MSQTPSNRRREGREAFDPEMVPDCPYKDPSKRADWLDGWNEAKETHHQEQADEREEMNLFDQHKHECPWHLDDGRCEATTMCGVDNCAPWYFKNLD